MNVDVILHGGFVITMEGAGTGVIDKGAVAVSGQKIVAVGEEDEVLRQYTADRYLSLIHI